MQKNRFFISCPETVKLDPLEKLQEITQSQYKDLVMSIAQKLIQQGIGQVAKQTLHNKAHM